MSSGFSQRVYDLALAIPPGRVTTYGTIAKMAGGGAPLLARSVSNLLSKAPNQSVIPYHRIVYADGKVWLPPGHEAARLALYTREGITVTKRGKIENFEEVFYDFNDY